MMKAASIMLVLGSLLVACSGPVITPLIVDYTSTPPNPTAATLMVTPASLTPRTIVTPATQDVLVIPCGWIDEWIPNFNPFSQDYLAFIIRQLIYEPLMLYQPAKAQVIPWLATQYRWEDGNKTLIFILRQGVKWSDGAPFTAQDVVFHFSLLRKIAGNEGYFQNSGKLFEQYLQDVSAPDDFTVVFTFKEINTLFFYNLIQIPITPKHIWEHIDDLMSYKNENPVGTGPFTQVTWFENLGAPMEKVIQIERNPSYWQPGKPAFQGIRFTSRPEENRLGL